ncbi:MAG: FecR domain-containing protein [Myxococcales bacterium]
MSFRTTPPAPPSEPAVAPVAVAPPAADAAATPAVEQPPAPEAVVAAVSGKVEMLRGGNWSSLHVGQKVGETESIRALARSTADLALGPKATLTLAEETELTIAKLDAAEHRVRLGRGRVTAAYEPEGERVLRIKDRSGKAVAEARAARFSAMATEGTFVVATETGTVNLASAGASVQVEPGKQSIARSGAAPSAATPIPVALLLRVAAASKPSVPCDALEGTASPGAEVFVDGSPVAVGPDGRFRYRVEGRSKKQFRVVTRDATGRSTEQLVRCRAPPAPPGEKIDAVEIRWHE